MVDSTFAEAWALLSVASSHAFLYGIDRTPARRERGLEAAQRALSLAPDLPEAHLALGMYYYWIERDYTSALTSVARAARLRPGWADAVVAEGLIERRAMRWGLAIEHLRRGADLDPRNYDVLDNLAQTLVAVREFDEAERLFDAIHALGVETDADEVFHHAELYSCRDGDYSRVADRAPLLSGLLASDTTSLRGAVASDDVWAFDQQAWLVPYSLLRARYHHLMGDQGEAAREARVAISDLALRIDAEPGDPRPQTSRAEAWAYVGQADSARSDIEQALELASNDWYRTQRAHFVKLEVLSVLGDAAGAAEQLQALVTEPGLCYTVASVIDSPILNSVRDAPVFAESVRRLEEAGR